MTTDDGTHATAEAKIDRITLDLLHQLELQTQAVMAVLELAPAEQREAMLAKIGEVRGRLVRLRAELLGRDPPHLVSHAPKAARNPEDPSG